MSIGNAVTISKSWNGSSIGFLVSSQSTINTLTNNGVISGDFDLFGHIGTLTNSGSINAISGVGTMAFIITMEL